MEFNRHVVLDSPDRKSQVQIFEYATNMVVWLDTSPEIYTPKADQTVKSISNNFISALQVEGCSIVSDKCA